MLTRTVVPSLLLLLAAFAALTVAAPARADDVFLTNGEVFEGVIADVQGDRVAIRLPHGVIRLPMSRVERVESSASAFEEYLVRSEELAGGTDAQAWLELALWARQHDLGSGMRRAALEAARLDPALDGLAPVLEELGYAWDDELGRWVAYADFMTRRGYVQVEGRWLPAEVVAEVTRKAREEHERELAQRRADQVDRAINLLALAQIQQIEQERRERAERERQGAQQGLPIGLSPYGGNVVGYLPGAYVGGRGRRHGPRATGPPRSQPGAVGPPPSTGGQRGRHQVSSWDDVARHQPGSIIPIKPATSTLPATGPTRSGRQRP